MSKPSARRARILRIRQLEYRLSVARLNNATAARSNLTRIGVRIANLRATLNPDRTLKTGTAFQAMYEMAARLDDANAQLAAPIDQAETTVRHFEQQRNTARLREDGAERLRAKSEREESYQSAVRADTNRPFRKRMPVGGRNDL